MSEHNISRSNKQNEPSAAAQQEQQEQQQQDDEATERSRVIALMTACTLAYDRLLLE